MYKFAGLVAAAVLAVASLAGAGMTATVALSDGDIGWDGAGTVSALHAPGAAQSALTSDNVVGTH
jgi:hypothetical protein